VYACERLTIGEDETADHLQARLVDAGTRLLLDALRRGLGDASPQEGETTYAEKLDPAELRIDWTRSADEVHRLVRLGRAWTTFRDRRLRILDARRVDRGPEAGALDGVVVGTGDGRGLELVTVQPEGKQPQPAAAWRNGARPQPGELFV
jgi:methionyl-tRNA formyltransferase